MRGDDETTIVRAEVNGFGPEKIFKIRRVHSPATVGAKHLGENSMCARQKSFVQMLRPYKW